jgi:hypothetical protein
LQPQPQPGGPSPADQAAQAVGSANQQAITGGTASPVASLGNGQALSAAVGAGALEPALQNMSGGGQHSGAYPNQGV